MHIPAGRRTPLESIAARKKPHSESSSTMNSARDAVGLDANAADDADAREALVMGVMGASGQDTPPPEVMRELTNSDDGDGE